MLTVLAWIVVVVSIFSLLSAPSNIGEVRTKWSVTENIFWQTLILIFAVLYLVN